MDNTPAQQEIVKKPIIQYIILGVLLLILVGVIAGALIFYVFPPRSSVYVSVKPTDISSLAYPSNDIVDWHTYVNNEGQYSFRYPNSWHVETSQTNNLEAFFGPEANSVAGIGGIEVRELSLNVLQKLSDFVSDIQGFEKTNWGAENISQYLFTPEKNNMTNTIITPKELLRTNGRDGTLEKYEGDQNGYRYITKTITPSSILTSIYINSLDARDLKIFYTIISTLKSTKTLPNQNYTCPTEEEWANCMGDSVHCEQDYIQWSKENCF
jgi:hypothetical protein